MRAAASRGDRDALALELGRALLEGLERRVTPEDLPELLHILADTASSCARGAQAAGRLRLVGDDLDTEDDMDDDSTIPLHLDDTGTPHAALPELVTAFGVLYGAVIASGIDEALEAELVVRVARFNCWLRTMPSGHPLRAASLHSETMMRLSGFEAGPAGLTSAEIRQQLGVAAAAPVPHFPDFEE